MTIYSVVFLLAISCEGLADILGVFGFLVVSVSALLLSCLIQKKNRMEEVKCL